MLEENKVAVGKTVMGNSETLLAILPTQEGMLIEKMFYADEIKEIPKEFAHPEVNEAELTMAKQLIQTMDKPFEPELYHDEYQERLRELIHTKIAGKEVVQAADEKPDNIINLMDALKASIEQNKPKKTTRRKRKPASGE